MKRQQAFTAGAALAAVVTVVLVAIWWPWSSSSKAPGEGAIALGSAGVEKEIVRLYFPGPDRSLEEEEREIEPLLPAEEKARRILQEIIAGPRREGLYAPLPAEVVVQGTYAGKNHVLYVDLHRPESGPPPAAGSLQERLMVYSLVNSVTANVDGVDRVAILWNGNQPSSLSGHLDNGKPLAANLGLVAASR